MNPPSTTPAHRKSSPPLKYDGLFEAIVRQHGLNCQESWQKSARFAVEKTAHRLGLSKSQALERLERDPAALNQVVYLFTVPESYFFRQREQFTGLATYLDKLMVDAVTRPTIWSAGCCRGEEAYTVVATLLATNPSLSPGRVRVVGSDVNPEAIAIARHGKYESWSLRGVEPHEISRFFEPAGAGCFRFKRQTLVTVEFLEISLKEHLAHWPSASVDVIFFRNVAVYLNAQYLHEVYVGFHRVLKEGGMLFVSPTDPRPPERFFSGYDELVGTFRRGSPEVLSAAKRVERTSLTSSVRSLTPRHPPPRKVGIRDPKQVEAYYRRAREFADRGSYTDALEAIESLLKYAPGATEGYLLKGQVQLELGEVKQALQSLARGVELSPSDALTRYWYALALKAAARDTEAVSQLTRIVDGLSKENIATISTDGATTLGELLDAAKELMHSME